MNEPIQGEFVLDPDFNRSENDYGSDIFIVGFKSPDGWKRDIISKILDSFMAAIVFNSLRIDVDGIEINSETLKDVVFNDLYINKNMKKSIVSQYMLLTDTEHRYEDVITVQEYGNARLYLMEFSGEDEQYATNNCVMIRYPYMKIKELNRISSLPCSALCIIENNQLNTILRNVENPQHTNWEFNRIEDPSEKAEVQAIYKDLLDQIRDNITRHLASSDDTKTDLEGAGEYLPITENDDKKSKNEGQKKIIDKPNIRKNKVKAKNINMNASIEDPNGNGVEVDFLNANDEGEEEQVVPSGNNKGGGGSLHGDNEEHGDPDPNGHIGLRHAELRGMSYLFYCKNKKNREYGVSFSSDFDEDEAYFELYAVDDAGGKDQVNFERCFINEIPVEPINESIIKLKLQKGQRYNILMVTDQEDLFSGEVKVYAYR